MREVSGGLAGHAIFPWKIKTGNLPGPTVSEIVSKASELLPDVPLDKIKVISERCCPGSDNCHAVYIGLCHNGKE
jgi:hypothetical protein